MKATKKITSIVLLLVLLLSGCESREEVPKGEPFVYYLNLEGTSLVKRAHEYQAGDAKGEVQEAVETMATPAEDGKLRSLFSEGVEATAVELEERIAGVHFNGAFNRLSKSAETLLLGGVTYTLTQFKEVDGVRFYIDDTELTNEEDVPRGVFYREDFIENIGASIHTTETAKVSLFYGNKDGDKLIAKTRNVHYNSNSSIEKLVVEQLIKGTSSQDAMATIASEVIVLGVTVKDGTCYVNLSDSFMTTQTKTTPEVTIYSLVNSIIQTSESVEKVQISVNGESSVSYKGIIDLDKPFEMNQDIIEE